MYILVQQIPRLLRINTIFLCIYLQRFSRLKTLNQQTDSRLQTETSSFWWRWICMSGKSYHLCSCNANSCAKTGTSHAGLFSIGFYPTFSWVDPVSLPKITCYKIMQNTSSDARKQFYMFTNTVPLQFSFKHVPCNQIQCNMSVFWLDYHVKLEWYLSSFDVHSANHLFNLILISGFKIRIASKFNLEFDLRSNLQEGGLSKYNT